MLNQDKHKTVLERVRAYCESKRLSPCTVGYALAIDYFGWLAIEADEDKPEPCFYCGHEMHYRVEHRNFTDKHWLECTNSKCNFESPKYESKTAAISAHNRVARAVRAAKEGANDEGK